MVPVGTYVSLYGIGNGTDIYLSTITTTEEIDVGWSSASFQVGLYADEIEGMNGIKIRADDDGTGLGVLEECSELDNIIQSNEAICP